MFVGCIRFGPIADKLGRRSIFISALAWYSVASAIMAFQNFAAQLNAWRFLAGIGAGLEQVTIDTFLAEIVPVRARGKAFAFCQFVQFSAVPVVALLGWLMVPRQPLGFAGWRWVTLIGSAGALLAWQFRRGLPESPRWLALHGREAEAERVMKELEGRVESDAGDLLPPPRPAAAPAPSAKNSLREILRPPYGKRTLVMSVFNLTQTIAFYGFGSWVPTLLIAKGIHITTSLQYAFIIAIANPVGPLPGNAGGGSDGAQMADRLCRRGHWGVRLLVRPSGRSGAGDCVWGDGDPLQQLDAVCVPQLSKRAVSHSDSGASCGIRVGLEPRERRAGGAGHWVPFAGGRNRRCGPIHRWGDGGHGDYNRRFWPEDEGLDAGGDFGVAELHYNRSLTVAALNGRCRAATVRERSTEDSGLAAVMTHWLCG